MFDASIGRKYGHGTMQAQVAAARSIASHFDGAVIGPGFDRLERLDGRFLRREPRGKALGGNARRAGSAVRGFVRCERPAHVGVAEAVECRRDLGYADDVNADPQGRNRIALSRCRSFTQIGDNAGLFWQRSFLSSAVRRSGGSYMPPVFPGIPRVSVKVRRHWPVLARSASWATAKRLPTADHRLPTVDCRLLHPL
jgi:hypothetical protein